MLEDEFKKKVNQYILDNYNYDPNTGIISRFGKTKGNMRKDGYLQFVFVIDGKRNHMLNHRVAYLLFYKKEPDGLIDHVNRNRSDNRIINLRLVNRSQNRFNINKNKNNTSGFKGVSLRKKKRKYEAEISIDHKRIYIGCYNTAEEAAKAYDRKARELFGEYASCNFPDD